MTLSVDGWGWRYAGRKSWAIRNLDLQVSAGSRVLLLGASGSGKSTLMAGLTGLLTGEDGEFEGAITVDEHPSSSPQARGLIALVQQDPDTQLVMEHVGDEVAFGLENLGVPEQNIWSRVRDALAQVGLHVPLNHPTAELSGGEKQRLALACALAMQPQVLLLDEPASNLDPRGVREVREAVRAITGTTLVIIEHQVDAWLDQIDRVIVLDRGELIADGPPRRTLEENRRLLLEAGIWVPGEPIPVRELEGSRSGSSILTRDLDIGYQPGRPIIQGLNLDLGRGVSTCIVGENGAGKSTLALTVAGLLDPLSGSVERLGTVQMVFQEPSYQFLKDNVRGELELSLAKSELTEDQRRAKVNHFLQMMRLDSLSEAHPQSLSGGEKRRLSVATGLIGEPDILILDEPTFGQDRNTWLNLVQLLQMAVRRGTTLVIITHDQELVRVLGQEIVEVNAEREQRVPKPEDKQGLLDRVNPTFRILALMLMTVPLFASVDLVSASVALGVELILLPLVGWGPRKLLRRTWPLLVAAPLAGLSMLLYARHGGAVYWSWGPAAITQNSVQLALAIAVRVLALGIPAIVLLSSAKPTAMADSLTQVARMPARPVLATLAGIRLVSLMLADWQSLRRARISRGLEQAGKLKEFAVGSLALFTFALRRAGTLSYTMEARGFGAETGRSRARTSTTSAADPLALGIALLVPVIALGTAVAVGSFRWFGL